MSKEEELNAARSDTLYIPLEETSVGYRRAREELERRGFSFVMTVKPLSLQQLLDENRSHFPTFKVESQPLPFVAL